MGDINSTFSWPENENNIMYEDFVFFTDTTSGFGLTSPCYGDEEKYNQRIANNLSLLCRAYYNNRTDLPAERGGRNRTGLSLALNLSSLVLLIFPLLTVFGNVLVVLSVYRERSLRTVTNYFIVSLAIADIMVATFVMPLSVYVEVKNSVWELGDALCDMWVAFDVLCCTASILNLTAISIDRFIAVTQPLKYAKHKNSNRVYAMLVLTWIVSIAISSPIALGMNYTARRQQTPRLCIFYNSDFIIFSSMGSFYIPCIVMILLYWKIFGAIRQRAKRAAEASTRGAAGRARVGCEGDREGRGRVRCGGKGDLGHVCAAPGENESDFGDSGNVGGETVGRSGLGKCCNDGERRQRIDTNVRIDGNIGSDLENRAGILFEFRESKRSVDECYTQGLLSVTKANYKCKSPFVITTDASLSADDNITTNYIQQSSLSTASFNDCSRYQVRINLRDSLDAGIIRSQNNCELDQVSMEDLRGGSEASPLSECPYESGTVTHPLSDYRLSGRQDNSSGMKTSSCIPSHDFLSPAGRRLSVGSTRSQQDGNYTKRTCQDSGSGEIESRTGSRSKEELLHAIRFNFRYKTDRPAKIKDRSSHRRERKATKTLAIVLGVFLLCWVPFFTINIMNAICIRYDLFQENAICDFDPILFSFFVWLGYLNSFLNPAIYTIFNIEFRRAFKKLLTAGPACK